MDGAVVRLSIVIGLVPRRFPVTVTSMLAVSTSRGADCGGAGRGR